MKLFIEIAGWMAAALILSAYGLVTSGRLTVHSPSYQLLNIVGAMGFIINSGYNGAIPSAALNLVWLFIALYGIWRIRAKGDRPGEP